MFRMSSRNFQNLDSAWNQWNNSNSLHLFFSLECHSYYNCIQATRKHRICLSTSSYMDAVNIFLSCLKYPSKFNMYTVNLCPCFQLDSVHCCVNVCKCNPVARILWEFLLVNTRLIGCLNWHGIRSLTKGLDASPSDGLLIKCLNVFVKTLRTRLDS